MQHERISIDPKIMVGKPCIKGTRITVEHVLRKLAAGWDREDLSASHPHLSEADIAAALDYAADHIPKAIAA